MKTYFAKYLPVEGKIQEGDLLETRDGIHPVVKHPSNSILCYRIPRGTYHDIQDWHKKVKLFLCSRDIQIGDKITYSDDISAIRYTFSINEDGSIGVKGDMSSLTSVRMERHELLKVIGEISEDATWVKEGDEFDEEEVKIIGTKGISQMPVYVEIKCSQCKTFH